MCKRSSLAPPVPTRQIYAVAGAGTSDRSAPRPAVARAMRFVQSVRLYFRAISPRLVIDPVVKVRRCDADGSADAPRLRLRHDGSRPAPRRRCDDHGDDARWCGPYMYPPSR